MTVSASDSAKERTTSASASTASRASAHASSTYRRNAAATWSFLDLPAWILRPTSRAALDRRVDVLVGIEVGRGILGDLCETSLDFVELFRRQKLNGGQSSRVQGGRFAVVGQKLRVIHAEKRPHLFVERSLDSPRPGRHVRAIMPG